MHITECPRDAMQGITPFIPTAQKINYINALLKVGFDTIDVGSFVSPKAIPQLKDTAEVLQKISLSNTKSKLLTIVANTRGAEEAVQFDQITYLGFPFSISQTFQLRNTNSTIEQSLQTVSDILNICQKHQKIPVIYLSMAFGNPYGDKWNREIVIQYTKQLEALGVTHLALSDTIGTSTPTIIADLFSTLIPECNNVTIGAHLHTQPDKWQEKISAAYANGCRRFDAAIKGFGGCPMAEDQLVGNLATENLIKFADDNNLPLQINRAEFANALLIAAQTFPS